MAKVLHMFKSGQHHFSPLLHPLLFVCTHLIHCHASYYGSVSEYEMILQSTGSGAGHLLITMLVVQSLAAPICMPKILG